MKNKENKESAENSFNIRFAEAKEAAVVVAYMHKLGEFQKMSAAITVTEEDMYDLLANKHAEVIFAEYKGAIIGFAFFCTHASAFIGKTALYIDAFYMNECERSKGFGKMMMEFLAQTAVKRGCKRLEWGCLDWNEKAINFYKNLGSYSIDIMTIHRLDGEKLISFAGIDSV